jgi:hypothetical protein
MAYQVDRVPGSTVVPSTICQQTWQETQSYRRRWAEDVGIAEAISKLVSQSVICRPVLRIHDQSRQQVGKLAPSRVFMPTAVTWLDGSQATVTTNLRKLRQIALKNYAK